MPAAVSPLLRRMALGIFQDGSSPLSAVRAFPSHLHGEPGASPGWRQSPGSVRPYDLPEGGPKGGLISSLSSQLGLPAWLSGSVCPGLFGGPDSCTHQSGQRVPVISVL